MSILKVREYFDKYGIGDRILEFPVSSKTVEEASIAIGCEPKEIAKTLSFDLDNKVILIVMAGDAKIDNHKYREKFHKKAKMLKFDEVNIRVGHMVGGVCPFGINEGIDVYLDESLKRFEYVYPACGSGNSAIKLNILELEKYSNYLEWVDVCKDWH